MVETDPICSSVFLGTTMGLERSRPRLASGQGQGGLPRRSAGPGAALSPSLRPFEPQSPSA